MKLNLQKLTLSPAAYELFRSDGFVSSAIIKVKMLVNVPKSNAPMEI